MKYDFETIYKNFKLKGEFVSCEPYGEGHINETFLLVVNDEGKDVKYIIQRINSTLFTDVPKLMNNIKLVTEFARKKIIEKGGNPDRETLNIVPAVDGKPYYTENGKDFFRVYVFIDDATSYQVVKDPQDFYYSAVAFGDFANLLAEFDATKLYEPLPRFHDTAKRFNDLLIAIDKNAAGRKDQVKAEIDFALSRKDMTNKIVDKLKSGEIPTKVTHNDTKLNNVMLDNETGKPVAVIDLDTIMPGTICYDFGDSIRFGCNPAAEDEKDLSKVNFDINLFEMYVKGYMSSLKKSMTKAEAENLALGAIMMTYECGIRFLADHLDGDVYFRVHREGHNLDRCRTQFKLVSDMEKALPEMNKIVEKYYNAQIVLTKTLLNFQERFLTSFFQKKAKYACKKS